MRGDGRMLALLKRRLRPGGTAHHVLENVFAMLREALAIAKFAARLRASSEIFGALNTTREAEAAGFRKRTAGFQQ